MVTPGPAGVRQPALPCSTHSLPVRPWPPPLELLQLKVLAVQGTESSLARAGAGLSLNEEKAGLTRQGGGKDGRSSQEGQSHARLPWGRAGETTALPGDTTALLLPQGLAPCLPLPQSSVCCPPAATCLGQWAALQVRRLRRSASAGAPGTEPCSRGPQPSMGLSCRCTS